MPFTFLGPAPYIPIAPNLWMTLLASLMLQVAGFAFVTLASFTSCLHATYKMNGASQSVSTTSKVSGIWTGAYCLGHFLGPTLTGVVYDKVSICTPYKLKSNISILIKQLIIT